MTLTLQAFQHPARMTAVAERGIQSDLPRLNLQNVQNLVDTDGNVHARRCLSLRDDFLNVLLILFRV